MRSEHPSKFINIVNRPLNLGDSTTIYSIAEVVYERKVIYHDFVLSLVDLVCQTYLGDDVSNDNDKLNHFNWCWNKTITNFRVEGVEFGDTIKLREYFLDFSVDMFYSSIDKSDNVHYNLLNLWNYLFDFSGVKTAADIETFQLLYELFDKSLKKI